ncbi:MAG: response regulator [Sandaracinaceae bacterium]|nr:response regulator [Sandaracinaceae bacterium]
MPDRLTDAEQLIAELATYLPKDAPRERVDAVLASLEGMKRDSHIQTMETIGRLAGGIAHDFNNLLSVILMYSTLGYNALKEGELLREDLGEIRTAAQRAAALTKKLLAFGNQHVVQHDEIELEPIIAAVQTQPALLAAQNITVKEQLDPMPASVRGDGEQLAQLLEILVTNAREAMPSGGTLSITTENFDVSHDAPATRDGVAPGSYLRLSVSDTGIGMDSSMRLRIFEPFFTTKEIGKGSGLGLATAFAIVRQHQGSIQVTSEPGHGTTVQLYLPRLSSPSAAPSLAVNATSAHVASETILLVEDDQALRVALASALEAEGYRVLVGANGADAIERFAAHVDEVDLLLTDVVMPRMNGRELATRLLTMRPSLRVLYMSGHTDDAALRQGVLHEGVAFLQKPITPEDLSQKVREVLDH